MNPESLFPGYVPRPEEQPIRDEAMRVQATGASRALLLYGPGGVGKTSLVRGLSGAFASDQTMVWLEPIDVDDPEYWLLSNLERKVAQQLDPENQYFDPYLKYLSQLPSYAHPRIGRETVVSHLGRIKRVFVDCYTNYITETGKTVVMIFDTIEAMRGVYLLYTLTQWIKALPGTFYILSGRPMLQAGDRPDPIRDELEDPHQNLPVTTLMLGEFAHETALDYLRSSPVAKGLSAEEAEKLVLLTRGHPLWLAFTISYLLERGVPKEAEAGLAVIQQAIPEVGDLTTEGHQLHESFKRRLVTPYREVDFWHEAIKRLAVVRQGVTQPIWQRLMSDYPVPEGISSPDETWQVLQSTPWIRTRANGRYVALHDAVAEELAQRIIALHDQGQQWRRELWARTADIYRGLTEGPEAELAESLIALDDRILRLEAIQQPLTGKRAVSGADTAPEDEYTEETALISEAERLDMESRELDQLKVVSLYYKLLSDFAGGAREFLALFRQAKRENNVFFLDRLALEMQRFMPGSAYPYVLDDVIRAVLDDFRAWLSSDGRDFYLEIGMAVGGYLIDNEQPKSAIELLGELPEDIADGVQLCRLNILMGNAHMRIPRGMEHALSCLERALDAAKAMVSPGRQAMIAEVYKELGFYYRNAGRWREADEAYQEARNAILVNMSTRVSDQDHEDMASIQTNWAYLKGLKGDYRDGSSLVESAIAVRQRMKLSLQEGISWSVSGEIYRYERRFEKAWSSFSVAEQIFQGQRDWSWLGTMYQQQAICLLQATEDKVNLVPGRSSTEHARRLITLALDICRDQNIRAYPSALNRAGRIFGAEDFEVGLRYLEEGIDWARRLSDGWFWFASLIEYVELSYRAWMETGRGGYRDAIADHAYVIQQAISEYEFLDLKGRWLLLCGHLIVNDFLASRDRELLSGALENYKEGFGLVAMGYVGSSGASTIAREFGKFGLLFSQLPGEVRAQWLAELRSAWRDIGNGSTPLLARLEQLY